MNKSAPTPRLGAHPDLTGVWHYTDWIGNYMTGGGRRCGPTQENGCNRSVNQTEDFELYSPSRFGQLNRPLYKPEHWDKIQELDMWTNKFDPVMTCQPLGVPRQGPPRRIYQSENDVTFLYFGGDAGGGYGEYRIIPTDGRKRARKTRSSTSRISGTPWDAGKATRSCSTRSRSSIRPGSRAAASSTPIGCTSWRSSRVRATRILYDVTVEDPEVLLEPWVIPTRTMRRNTNPNAGLLRERGNCETSQETEAAASQIRH